MGHVADSSSILSYLIIVLAGLGGFGYISKFNRERSEKSQEAIRKDLQSLQGAYRIQEKRLARLEIDNHRKSRQVLFERQVNDYFEQIFRIMLPFISKTSPDEKKRIDGLLMEMTEYRRKFQMEQLEWEDGQDPFAVYMDEITARADG